MGASRSQFTIILYPDAAERGFTVMVPALPGCMTEGETLEEAIAMAREAIAGYLEDLQKRGEPVPEEHDHPQAIVIAVA